MEIRDLVSPGDASRSRFQEVVAVDLSGSALSRFAVGVFRHAGTERVDRLGTGGPPIQERRWSDAADSGLAVVGGWAGREGRSEGILSRELSPHCGRPVVCRIARKRRWLCR